jgi:hypothetical protein
MISFATACTRAPERRCPASAAAEVRDTAIGNPALACCNAQVICSLRARLLEDRHAPGHPIDPIEEPAVQMNVQIGRRAEALNESDRAGAGCAAFQSGSLDQKCRNDPANDRQH